MLSNDVNMCFQYIRTRSGNCCWGPVKILIYRTSCPATIWSVSRGLLVTQKLMSVYQPEHKSRLSKILLNKRWLIGSLMNILCNNLHMKSKRCISAALLYRLGMQLSTLRLHHSWRWVWNNRCWKQASRWSTCSPHTPREERLVRVLQ